MTARTGDNGLTNSEVASALARHGYNELWVQSWCCWWSTSFHFKWQQLLHFERPPFIGWAMAGVAIFASLIVLELIKTWERRQRATIY